MENCANCQRTIGNLENPCIWGGHVVCQSCHYALSAASPHMTIFRPAAGQQIFIPIDRSFPGITTPLLVAAISNVIVGIFWTVLCWTAVIGIPMIFYGIYDICKHSGVYSCNDMRWRAGWGGVLNILFGFFNVVALICGIVLLINQPKIPDA